MVHVPLIARVTHKLVASERSPRAPHDARAAAVAAILREQPDGPAVLLMKRVERVGDPWSGHISLPGGGHDPTDRDLLVTAIRETREELGLELAENELLGSLAPLSPRTSGPSGMHVTPFVFAAERPLIPVCGPEATAAFWLPLERAIAGEFDDHFIYPNTQTRFPAWRFEGHLIWGLTRRILDDLIATARDTQSG